MTAETMREQGSNEVLSEDWARLIGVRVGNFVIDRPLARGGMGAVFVARHPTLGREVAAKFLNRELNASPSVAQRFLEEARLMTELRHRNIVEIFDFGEIGGRFYYVMELLKGVDLHAAIGQRRGPFEASELVPHVTQICEALEVAHAAGVVHRDLKPGNVFVLDGTPMRIKLMDFGVAKLLHSRGVASTMHGQIIGTPSHMAPEQALGHVHAIAPQTDLYALGAILYEMLTGAPVFQDPSDLTLMMMHVHATVRPLREVVPEIPDDIARLVQSCLAKDPSERPRSAMAFAAAWCAAIETGARPKQLGLAATHFAADLARISIIPEPGLELAVTAHHVRRSGSARPPAPAAAPGPAPQLPKRDPARRDAVSPAGSSPVVPAVSPTRASQAPVAAPAPSPAVAVAVAAGAAAPVAAVAERSFALAVVAPAAPAGVLPPEVFEDPTSIDEGEEEVLNRLLARAQRKGDFPSFVRNVTDINNKADLEGAYSACHLGDAILKDYALTAKLLRSVNSNSGARNAGKIHSVKGAVVMLGFQRVRSLALSISVFSVPTKPDKRPELRDSAIRALVSGEIARALAPKAGVEDGEHAMVCSTFRGLGRHVVMHSLPDLYTKALALVEAHGVTIDIAMKRVLSISVEKLGIGIARKWRLPETVVLAMAASAAAPPPTTIRAQDRLSALAVVSNELCEAIATDPEGRAAAVEALAARYEKILRIGASDLPKIFQEVGESLESRYTSLLGVSSPKPSRYLQGIVDASVDTSAKNAAEKSAPRGEPVVVRAATVPPKEVVVAHAPTPIRTTGSLSMTDAKIVAPLVMQRISAKTSSVVDERAEALKARTADLCAKAGARPIAITEALEALVSCVGFRRAIALVPTSNKKELVVLAARGEDAQSLEAQFTIPMGTFGVNDLFSAVLNSGRPVFIDDAFDARTTARMPRKYYEMIGSPAFVLQLCALPSQRGNAILLCDLDSPDRLPGPQLKSAITDLCAAVTGLRMTDATSNRDEAQTA